MSTSYLRHTKRYQWATEGVRGDVQSRRKWFARVGFWCFKFLKTGAGGLFIEPITLESVDTIIVIRVKYKEKVWEKAYYLSPEDPIKFMTNLISKLLGSARARLKGINTDTDDIKITVRKIEK
jgi:hypothetical protein